MVFTFCEIVLFVDHTYLGFSEHTDHVLDRHSSAVSGETILLLPDSPQVFSLKHLLQMKERNKH